MCNPVNNLEKIMRCCFFRPGKMSIFSYCYLQLHLLVKWQQNNCEQATTLLNCTLFGNLWDMIYQCIYATNYTDCPRSSLRSQRRPEHHPPYIKEDQLVHQQGIIMWLTWLRIYTDYLSIYMYEQLFALTCISLVCLCWIWLCACKAIQLYQMTSPLLMGIIPIIPSLCSSCQQVIVRCVCVRERESGEGGVYPIYETLHFFAT